MHPPTVYYTRSVHRLAYEATHAFIIVDTNFSERTLLLNADIAMGYLGVRWELLRALAEEVREYDVT
jgi:hypothetical protein